ncbi:MAG: hypothetical protein WA821_05910, partial [Anaerolineales bacterium]
MNIPPLHDFTFFPVFRRWWESRKILIEWTIILVAAYLYAGTGLLNITSEQLLQEGGEHNEISNFSILAEIGLNRYGEVPLWNPYSMTGIPFVEDPLAHFWHPTSLLFIMLFGGINGMKVSAFFAFLLAGIGQWLFAHVFGVRGFSRLWSALIFMFSGGLAFFWAYGWYQLLLGFVWFPWCFAALWWTLRRRDWTSIVLTALTIMMALTTGNGYSPLYLLGSLGVLTLLFLFLSSPSKRRVRFLRAVCVATISAGLLAVVFLPVFHGYPLFNRWGSDDPGQGFSLPIPYEVFQYSISDRSWEGADVLGLDGGGWKWFYIGASALVAAFCLAPLTLVRDRRRRLPLIAAGLLTLAILAWAGNKYTPVHYIYELIPFLYNFRFPNRLLVIAASPLLVVAGLGWQGLYRYVRQWGRAHSPSGGLKVESEERAIKLSIPLWGLLSFILIAVMAASIVDVYDVNKAFAFRAGESVDHTLENSLSWLKGHDHGLYYTQIGEGESYPPGVSIAYRYEMPLINFDYTRELLAWYRQHLNDVPFIAMPKYYVATPAIGTLPLPLPANAQKIYGGPGSYDIWYAPDALPAAFSAPPAQLQAGAKL